MLKTTNNLVKLTAKRAIIICLNIHCVRWREISSVKELKLNLIKVKVSEEFSNSILTVRNQLSHIHI